MYGIMFFLWFFVLLFSTIVTFVIINIFFSKGNNNQFTWRVLIFVSTGVWISQYTRSFFGKRAFKKK